MMNIRTNIWIAFILIIFSSCREYNAPDSSEKCFMDSSSHFLKNVPYSIQDLFIEVRRKLKILNEESFLQCEDNDFYIIYSRSGYQENEVRFIVKVFDTIAVIARKDIITDTPELFLTEAGFSNKTISNIDCRINTTSRLIDVDSVLPLKHQLDSFIRLLYQYNTPSHSESGSSVLYFNGDDYYIFSRVFLRPTHMKQIDSLFANSTVFQQL